MINANLKHTLINQGGTALAASQKPFIKHKLNSLLNILR